MDIFTHALVKVARNPIKRDKFKIKALQKDANTKPLNDDVEHVENHDLFFAQENIQQGGEHAGSQNEKAPNIILDVQSDDRGDIGAKGVIPSNDVITDKQQILHPKQVFKEPVEKSSEDDDVSSLDLYV